LISEITSSVAGQRRSIVALPTLQGIVASTTGSRAIPQLLAAKPRHLQCSAIRTKEAPWRLLLANRAQRNGMLCTPYTNRRGPWMPGSHHAAGTRTCP